MSKRFPFTLDRLYRVPPAAPGTRDMYHDATLPILKCRVTENGTKTLIVSVKVGTKAAKKTVVRLQGKGFDPSMDRLRRDAMAVYSQMQSPKSELPKRNSATLGQAAESWASSTEMQRVKASWSAAKLRAVKTHCQNLWSCPLDQVTTSDVRSVLSRLEAEGYKSMPRLIRSLITQVFEFAKDTGIIPEQLPVPVPKRLKYPVSKRDRRLSQGEMTRLMTALADDSKSGQAEVPLRLIVLVALLTAQRKGNILSMKWDDIDPESRIWTIAADQTKTRSVYRVALHDTVWQLLTQHRFQQLQNRYTDSWVFPSVKRPGNPIVSVKRAWEKVMAEAALNDFRFHDLRHTAASIAFEQCGDLKATQLFLQHATSATTADRYIHTQGAAHQRRASDAVVQAVAIASGGSNRVGTPFDALPTPPERQVAPHPD